MKKIWTRPVATEVRLGLEINSYASAEMLPTMPVGKRQPRS
ncbi:MAG: pyrroloquinoline quinone precursor peptide PqqA [Rhodospirillales bacterium]|nr:pyrroloquinoline quinone precursor peptide PqqA [Rhodospirillales bacterium]